MSDSHPAGDLPEWKVNRKKRRELRKAAYAASSKTPPAVDIPTAAQSAPTSARTSSDPDLQTQDNDSTPTDWDGLTDREKLARRPIEEDTRILSESFVQAGDVPVLLENWKWVMEGTSGWTAVLLTAHVVHVHEAGLLDLLRFAGVHVADKPTITRGPVYTFVNFGFKTAD